jgi:hypothetical protein
MEPEDQLALSIAAAKSEIHNPSFHESPWYEVYNVVFNDQCAQKLKNVAVAPQLRLSLHFIPDSEWEEDPKSRIHAKIPDFVLTHTTKHIFQAAGLPPQHVLRRRPVLIVEIKPMESGARTTDQLLAEAVFDVRQQAKAAFTCFDSMREVHFMVCAGDVWSWAILRKEELSPIILSDPSYTPAAAATDNDSIDEDDDDNYEDDDDDDPMNLFTVSATPKLGLNMLMTASSNAELDRLFGEISGRLVL